jgi:hypothetical protein
MRTIFLALAALACASLAGCNLPASAVETPTLSVTQAYQTVEARLTEAVSRTASAATPAPPTDSGVATLAPSATSTTSDATLTPTQAATGTTANNLCEQATPGNPIDVTIPDETKLQPGEEFTKTWRLVNGGTCTWTSEFDLVWFSGEKFNAPESVSLSGDIAPGQTVDLSVEMEAPQSPGTYISYWKLRSATGVLFGIGPSGGSAFWVQIVVVPGTTATTSPSPGATITPTVTPTAVIQASGAVTLEPDDALDLDSNQVNAGGEDLAYQATEAGHVLTPQGSGVGLAVIGAGQPTLSDCQTSTLIADPLPVDSLGIGTYLCYRTNMALPGWAIITGFDEDAGSLSLEINTWAVP